MNNFSSSKYYNVNSPVHRFNPKLKFMALILIMTSIFLPIGMTGAVICWTAIATLVFVANLNKVIFLKTLKPALFIISFIYLINIFVASTMQEGAWNATIYFVKLWSMLLLISIFNTTTKESEIIFAISWFIKPLKYLKVPVNEISLIISLGLRFVPNLFENAKSLIGTQKIRGMNKSWWNLTSQIKMFLNIFTPLMINSFKDANEISFALQSKGYKIGEKRTQYLYFKYYSIDFIKFVIVCSYLSLLIFMLIDQGNSIPWFADEWNYYLWNI